MNLQKFKVPLKENLKFLDIAIIKLPEKLNFSKHIQPVKLPSKNSSEFVGENAILSGFGVLNNRNKKEYRVRYANFTVISNDECMNYKKYFIETLNERNLCAMGISNKLESACAGNFLVF